MYYYTVRIICLNKSIYWLIGMVEHKIKAEIFVSFFIYICTTFQLKNYSCTCFSDRFQSLTLVLLFQVRCFAPTLDAYYAKLQQSFVSCNCIIA